MQPQSLLWADLPAAEAAAAQALIAGCPNIDLASGEARGLEGDAVLVVVESGLVVMRVGGTPLRRELVSCDAAAGAVLPAPDADETVHALLPATLTVISRSAREDLLEVPAVSRIVLDALETAARRARDHSRVFVHLRHRERVRERLLQLARDHGRVTRTGVRLDFPLTHELLAAMIGSARESVTRAVDELERERFLAREGRRYRLLIAPASLRR
ncbi:MAG TPA: Crp/Fnr family transcriptional regulator [Gaiellaceae bacterium]|nr:Crp/Fnr family transcriptional regulator [Gaiellaceae bacterium]